MPSLNAVFLMGNLTRDPELRYTPAGTAVASFGLAVNRRWKDRDGTDKEEVTFVDIEAWGRQAETVSQYLSKGSPAFVEGRLRLDQWESKTGEKRSKLKVTAIRVQFLGGRPGGAGAGAAKPPAREGRPAPSPPAAGAPPAESGGGGGGG